MSRLLSMSAPVPWSLAWSEDGELAPQDRFDLLQTLLMKASPEVQADLVAAVERIGLEQLSVLAAGSITGLCS